MVAFRRFALAIAALSAGSAAAAGAGPSRIVKRLDASQSSEASLAESIYENQATTRFSTATGTACPTGYQSYTNAAGTLLCCAGSVIDKKCFHDSYDLEYTADPAEVLAGDEAAPTPTSATDADVSSSTNWLTVTSFKGTATGATTGLDDDDTTTTSYSKLSQTLSFTGNGISEYSTATAGSSSGSSSNGALGAAGAPAVAGWAAVALAVVAGGAVALA